MNTGITKAQIQFIRSLQQKEGRKQHGLFVLEGEKLVNELLASPFETHSLYYTTDYESVIFKKQCFKIDNSTLSRISSLTSPNKVLAIAHIPVARAPMAQKIIYCCGIQDPGNAGTILRIADWYGIQDVIFSQNSVDVFGSKVVQSSMGAVLRINVNYDNEQASMLAALKQNNYTLYACDMQGEFVHKTNFEQRAVILMGSEAHGIPQHIMQMANKVITIERLGKAESLNVGVACGIVCEKIMRNE